MNTTISSLKDFLEVMGAETPWHAGRVLYKYTACGPWISYIRGSGEDVYYEDESAMGDIPNCIGIKIGTIVEGSDVEVGPVELMFPFSSNEFYEAVDNINKEADFYWKRDNLISYRVTYRKREYWIEWGWGEPWKLPKSIHQRVEEFIDNYDGEIPEDTETPVLGTTATIRRFDKSDLIY